MSQVQIPNLDHCIWRARINHLCKSGLDPIDCKSSFILSINYLVNKSRLQTYAFCFEIGVGRWGRGRGCVQLYPLGASSGDGAWSKQKAEAGGFFRGHEHEHEHKCHSLTDRQREEGFILSTLVRSRLVSGHVRISAPDNKFHPSVFRTLAVCRLPSES